MLGYLSAEQKSKVLEGLNLAFDSHSGQVGPVSLLGMHTPTIPCVGGLQVEGALLLLQSCHMPALQIPVASLPQLFIHGTN